jgi:hypothetical protein
VAGKSDYRLFGRCKDDQQSVLRGDEHVAIAEPVEDSAFEAGSCRLHVWHCPRRSGKRDLVRCGQVEAERLRPLGKLPQMGVTTKQVVDQLSAQALFPTDKLSTSLGVPLDEGGYRVVDSVQHRFGCSPDDVTVTRSDHLGKLSPQPPSSRKVEVDHTSRGYPEASCAPTECANSFEFVRLSPTPPDRRVRKQQQIVPQQVGRNSAGVSAGFSRHRGEPRVGRLWQRPTGRRCF